MVNYTEEEVLKLHEFYDGSSESVVYLAELLRKSKKSIIGKLAKEKIYVKKPYTTKLGEMPMTKNDMTHEIAFAWNLEYSDLEGLEKTPKNVLRIIYDKVLTGSQHAILTAKDTSNE